MNSARNRSARYISRMLSCCGRFFACRSPRFYSPCSCPPRSCPPRFYLPGFCAPALIVLLLALFSSPVLQAAPAPEQPDPELLQLLKQSAQSSSFNNPFTAQVWLMDMSQRLKPFVPDARQRLHLLRLLHQEARRHQIMPELVLALIEVESHFRANVTSSAGARGLMQVMPFWKSEIGRRSDNLFDPATNLKYGCAILSHYLKKERYDLTRALARYNGSLGRTRYPEKVMRAWTTRWQPR